MVEKRVIENTVPTMMRLTFEAKKLIRGVAEKRGKKSGRPASLVSVVEEAIRLLAKKEGVRGS